MSILKLHTGQSLQLPPPPTPYDVLKDLIESAAAAGAELVSVHISKYGFAFCDDGSPIKSSVELSTWLSMRSVAFKTGRLSKLTGDFLLGTIGRVESGAIAFECNPKRTTSITTEHCSSPTTVFGMSVTGDWFHPLTSEQLPHLKKQVMCLGASVEGVTLLVDNEQARGAYKPYLAAGM